MTPHELHDRVSDGLALSAGAVFAMAASEVDLVLKIIVGLLTCVFLGLGIYIRVTEIREPKPKTARRRKAE